MATLVNIDQSERALKSLLYAMSFTIVALLIYALTSKSWSAFGSTVGIGLPVAAAALVIGGLLGFLFGIPLLLMMVKRNSSWIYRHWQQLPRDFATARDC